MNSIEDRLDTLESVVDEQQAQIEAHKETIAAQQETIDAQRERLDAVEDDGGVSLPISRRRALQAGGALGLLGLGAGTASAQGSGQIGTADTPVGTIYTESIRNSNAIRLGAGLQSGSQFSLSPGNIVAGHTANTIAEETNGGTISGGGAGDSLENSIGDNCNFGTISGGWDNRITDGNSNATISGGSSNEVSGFRGTVSGGGSNEVVGSNAAIGGGSGNTVEGDWATVPGGRDNTAAENYSFAVGQNANATEPGAFVVGDSSDTEVTSAHPNEARFQMNVVANAFNLVDEDDDTDEPAEGRLYVRNGDLMYEYDSNSVIIEDDPSNG